MFSKWVPKVDGKGRGLSLDLERIGRKTYFSVTDTCILVSGLMKMISTLWMSISWPQGTCHNLFRNLLPVGFLSRLNFCFLTLKKHLNDHGDSAPTSSKLLASCAQLGHRFLSGPPTVSGTCTNILRGPGMKYR